MAMAEALSVRSRPSWNPLRVTGTVMRPNTLLIAKLMFVMLVVEAFPFKALHEPFLPFIPWLEVFRGMPGYALATQLLFFAAGIAILFNRLVRLGSAVAGSLVLLSCLQSIPAFWNHTTICGCVLLLCGLQGRDEEPWFVRWQLVVVYLGAWLNKQLDPDWLDGTFFENWMTERQVHRLYLWIAAMLPHGWLALAFSWTTIASEFLVMIGFATRRWWTPALWLGLFFHVGTFVWLRGNTFGYFVQALAIAYLAFLNWPRSTIEVSWPSGGRWPVWLRTAFARLDADRQVRWVEAPRDATTLEMRNDGRIIRGWAAVCDLLLYTPAFYWCFFGVFTLCTHALPHYPRFFASTALIAGAFAFFAVPYFQRAAQWRGARRLTAT